MKPESLDDAMRAAMKQADTVHVAPALLPPSRFEMREELGRGGTAVVYAAFDRKLGREVAVKVLRDENQGDAEMAFRFRREAETAAKLTHPNIVTVHDVGWDSGRMILVMERIRGRSLAGALADGEVDVKRGVEVLETVSRAVQFAHEQGVIHRDLKPGNVLLTEAGVPKVADFGLARRLDSQTALTASGTTLGTPGYMAPEQATGRTALLSVRTDVYSLGAILYHVLAGRSPHDGDNPADVIRQVAFDDPVAPRKLNPAAPADLELVALRALEKDPARRYPDAAAFADELKRHLEGARVLARPPSPVRRVRRWLRRHVAVTAAGSVFLLALAAWGAKVGVDAWRLKLEGRELKARIEAARDPAKALDLCLELKSLDPLWPGVDGMIAEKQALVRRATAERLTEEGGVESRRIRELEVELAAKVPERDALAAAILAGTPVEDRARLWQLETEIADLERRITETRARALGLHAQAVQADPNYAPPREFLTDYYWRAFRRAEWAGDKLHMAEAKGALKLYNPLKFGECDRPAHGSVRLSSSPPGAAVEILRYEPGDDPRLILKPVSDPPENLPVGSYLALLRLEGRRETRFPFSISRKQPRVEAVVRLLTDAEIGEGFVHVPAANLIVGAGYRRKFHAIGDLVVGRCEVTRAEYAEFLAALAASGPPEELAKRTPKGEDWPLVNGSPAPPGDPRLPVAGVSWNDATAYCAWRARRDGLPWRLPTRLEREALTRCADGRSFPWGDTFDWIWTNGGRSRDPIGPLPVGSVPSDQSPHGLLDLAGNVKEWCSTWQDRRTGHRAIRGGAWGDTDRLEFEGWFADGDPENEHDEELGFRIVRTVQPEK